ncbi:hypothetical protein BT93_L2012 [Corymbia citriodora subsp. variegata]|uniref:Uncharacterized protein n=1 Tax=Corymbia citriodora subsp. variegata TaxID=360336 RepID=A0A8T0CYW5_CORYI|nr:hypothetical protein BT93_L2012 [Corymbia citriodora subsp. variegata]
MGTCPISRVISTFKSSLQLSRLSFSKHRKLPLPIGYVECDLWCSEASNYYYSFYYYIEAMNDSIKDA